MSIKVHLSTKSGRVVSELQKYVTPHAFEDADVVIDFSHPNRTETLLEELRESPRPLVLGTSGVSKEMIEEAATQIPILFTPNFSLGILAMMDFIQTARSLFGESASYAIVETHHEKKVDAVSGTALALKEALGFDVSVRSLRMKGSLGEHRLIISTEDEEIELRHTVRARSLYAKGALMAAEKMAGKGPGLYNLKDVLQ